jgi:hypothetical protein
MPVTVLDPGPSHKVAKECTCGGCGATLQYIPNDIRSRNYRDIAQVIETVEWIDCPLCNKQVIL